jgi:hypothetical protein
MESNLKEITKTLKQTHADKQSNIPFRLVEKIIEIESKFQENRKEALRQLESLIDKNLDSEEGI